MKQNRRVDLKKKEDFLEAIKKCNEGLNNPVKAVSI